MEHRNMYLSLASLCGKEIPGFEVRYKNEHFLQKLIGFFLRWVIPFNRNYMKQYTTTMYPRVYFPGREWVKKNNYLHAFKVLAHEYVHLYDEREEGFKFKYRYTSPQTHSLLAVLAFGAFWWPPMMGALGFLVALLPFWSKGRRDIERRGYAMSMAVNYWRYGSVKEDQIKWVVRQFTGPSYYFMWPFSKDMDERIRNDVRKLESGRMRRGKPYFDIYKILKDYDLVVV